MNIAEPFARQALAAPERPALVVGAESLTYGQLLALVGRIASVLRTMGVGRNDLVITLLKAPGANVILPLALAWIGARSLGLPAGSLAETIQGLVDDTGPQFVIHDRDAELDLEPPGVTRQLRFADVVAAKPSGPGVPLVQSEPDEIWRVMTSSGTTGRAKAIHCSHGASIANATFQRVVFQTSPEDRLLIAVHPASGFATHYWLRALYAGACVHLPLEGADAAGLSIQDRNITQLITSPANAGFIVQRAAMTGSPSSSLRLMNVGGAAVSQRLRRELRHHVCSNLYINYGSTETGLLALLGTDLQDSHPDCAGRLVPWVEAQAVDENGRPLPAGSTGALRFRSPALSSRYSGAAGEGPANPFRNGWFYSTDVGSVTRDGLVYLAGRANEVLNLSGLKFHPEHIEAIMAEDRSVLECAAVAIPGPFDQPMLVAVVVAGDGFDPERLKRHCSVRIAIAPVHVVRVGKLPRNEAGKLLRDEVRRRLRPNRSGRTAASAPSAA